MQRMREFLVSITGAILLVIVIGVATVSASSANISRSYKADGNIAAGSLVSVEKGSPGIVQSANTNNAQQLVGVSVAINQSLLAINVTSSTIQVATAGTAIALVSTVNGSISVGDQISASPFNGVGMKAGPSTRIVGLAQASFMAGGSNTTTEKVTDKKGKVTNIVVGYIPVGIYVGTSSPTSSAASGLQRLGETLAGHPVSDIRIIISLIVAVVAIASIVTLIYASIYGSIVSIGRNPLAKYIVLRALGSVMGMVLLIAGISSTTIYLLLR